MQDGNERTRGQREPETGGGRGARGAPRGVGREAWRPGVGCGKGSYGAFGLGGSWAGASARLYQALKQRRAGPRLHVDVQHTNARDEADRLATLVRSELDPAELFVTEFTQVMGVHTGPGLLGFAFYSEA